MEFQLQLLASIMFLYFFRRCAIVMGSSQPLETPLLILLWLQVWLTQDALNAYIVDLPSKLLRLCLSWQFLCG